LLLDCCCALVGYWHITPGGPRRFRTTSAVAPCWVSVRGVGVPPVGPAIQKRTSTDPVPATVRPPPITSAAGSSRRHGGSPAKFRSSRLSGLAFALDPKSVSERHLPSDDWRATRMTQNGSQATHAGGWACPTNSERKALISSATKSQKARIRGVLRMSR
jgi:hypothetical protein